MLPRGEGSRHLIRVLMMPGRDDDEIDRRIPQHIVEIRGEDLDLILPREVAALHLIAADDGLQEKAIAALFHLGDEHRRAERARADQRVVDLRAWRLAMSADDDVGRVGSLRQIAGVVRIANQDAERQLAGGSRERAIRGRRLLDRDHLVDERLNIETAARDEIQVRLHVAIERPSHVAERVVVALDFVRGVVAAGPVRRAHQQIDFLAVENLALDLQADVADDDDGPLGARDFHREVDDGVRLGGRRNQRLVGAASARHVAHERLQLVGRARALLHTERLRAIDAR